MLCYTSDFKNVLMFYSHTNYKALTEESKNYWIEEKEVDTRYFSNLYPCEIKIDNVVYSSTETYFQSFKYAEGDKNFILRLDKTMDVASYGQRRLKLREKHIKIIEQLKKENLPYPTNSNNEDYVKKDVSNPVLAIDDWDTIKLSVMYTALRAKFYQFEEFRNSLLKTDDAFIIEHTKNDKQWADALLGNGYNFLGKLLMKLRDEIRTMIENEDDFSTEVSFSEIDFDFCYLRKPMKDIIIYDL